MLVFVYSVKTVTTTLTNHPKPLETIWNNPNRSKTTQNFLKVTLNYLKFYIRIRKSISETYSINNLWCKSMPNHINNTPTWIQEPETWYNHKQQKTLQPGSFNNDQYFSCPNYFNNVRAKVWRFFFRDYFVWFEQVHVG